MDECSKSN